MACPSGTNRRLEFENDCVDSVPNLPTSKDGNSVSRDTSTERKRKLECCEDVSPCENVSKAVRRSPRPAVKALKSLLSKRRKKSEELSHENFLKEFKASREVEILKDLERKLAQLDRSLHCELETISGHPSSAALSVFPCKEN